MRNRQFDFLRGVGIFLAVVGHQIQDIPSLEPCLEFIYSFHMPLLFFVSGFVGQVAYNRKRSAGYLGGQLVRLLIPYAVWITLGELLIGDAQKIHLLWFVQVFFRHRSDAYNALWFLPVLCIMKCMQFIMAKVFEGRGYSLRRAIAVYLLLEVFLSVFYVLSKDISVKNTIHFSVLFFVGLLYEKEDGCRKYVHNGYVILAAFLLYAVCFPHFQIRNGSHTTVLRITMSFCAVVILLNLEEIVDRGKKWYWLIEWFGVNSMPIYLLHKLFVEQGNTLPQMEPAFVLMVVEVILAIIVSVTCIVIAKVISVSDVLSFLIFGKPSSKRGDDYV